MSKLLPRLPLPPTANDVMVWDGTEFRPSKSVAINPIMAAISSAALAIAIGTGINDANRIGFLPSTSVPGSESLTMYVGGNAGPTWTARAGVVDLTTPDGGNFIFGTTTGTQHGTAANQKQGFYGATPIVQPANTTDLRTALINLGLYATGGASPLNLNGGAFSAATATLSGQLTSTLATGTAPFVVASTTVVANLNVSQLLGSTWASPAAIGTGTPAAGTFTTIGGTTISSSAQFLAANGSAATPSIALTNSATTGFYRQAADVLGLAIAGVEALRISSSVAMLNRNSVASGTAPISTTAGAFTLHGADSTAAFFQTCAYGATTGIWARRSNGTAAALTGLLVNNAIFTIQTQGYEPTTPGLSSSIQPYVIAATETWSNTAQGLRHSWSVTNRTTVTTVSAMRLEDSGSLLIGTTTDGMTAAGSLAVAQDFAHRGTLFGIFNTAPIAKKTGYGTPTGNAYQASFAAGSITLPNLAAAVAQLILDLKAYGQIGT